MKKRNASIDIFRIVCALMVVSVHTAPLSEFGYGGWYFAVQIFPRLGVPFFFCTMGYYYIGSLLKGEYKFRKTMKHLLTTYGLWSIIYYIPDFKNVLNGNAPLIGFFTYFIKQFLIYGSREHFWFFPAVFFSIIISSIFAKIGKLHCLAIGSIGAYFLGLLGCSYYKIGNSIVGLTEFINSSHYALIRRILLMGFPFFMMGYFLQRVNLNKIKNNKCIIMEGIYLLGFLVEIFMVHKLQLQANIYITVFLYLLLFNTMLLLLKNSSERYACMATVTKDLSNFMYYSHPLLMSWINKVMFSLKERNATGTELFVTTVIMSISIGVIFYKIDNKYLNILYK